MDKRHVSCQRNSSARVFGDRHHVQLEDGGGRLVRTLERLGTWRCKSENGAFT
jgi:hypothetical protein